MKFDRPPIFTPNTPGPYGVDSTSSAWYVIDSRTLVGVRVGRIGGRPVNYFDRAMSIADERNRKESKT